ncbi:MAG: ABC-type transport auxiliary lipoprotein family protein [Alphaproteobacteria bacterium]
MALHKTMMMAVLAATTLLTGCSSVELGGTPPRLWTLTPKTTIKAELPPVDWQLLIEQPQASAGLDTPRIALAKTALELDYYKGVSWVDRAPSMVQTMMVQTFENTRRIVAVGRKSVNLRADYILQSELREFQALYKGSDPGGNTAPIIHVRLNAKIVQMPYRTIAASRNFETCIPAKSNSMDDIIAAFDRGLGRVLKHLTTWTLNEERGESQTPYSSGCKAGEPVTDEDQELDQSWSRDATSLRD